MIKKMFSTWVFVILAMCSVAAQKGVTISFIECKKLIGCWQGILHYSGTIIRKPFTTTADLVVKQIGHTNKLLFVHTYAKDPQENTIDTIVISKDGKKLNQETIKVKRYSAAGDLEIITESTGFDHDNNKAAVVRKTYIVGKKRYNYKKQVQLQGQEEWLDREDFFYSSAPCK